MSGSWEYHIVDALEPDLDLAALGREGWELVGTPTIGDRAKLYFKRPAQSFRERVTLDQKERYYRAGGPSPSRHQDTSR